MSDQVENSAVVRHLRVAPSEPDSAPSLDAALADLVAHREANEQALGSYVSGLDDAISMVRDHLQFGSGPNGEDASAPLSDLDARQVAAVPALLRLCDERENARSTNPSVTPVLTTWEVRTAVADAVPGEDARDLAEIRRIAEVHPDAPRGELLAEVRRLVENDDHCTSTHYALDGGDVPARLAAAGDVLHAAGEHHLAHCLRVVVCHLAEPAGAPLRPGVAAALARTPHDEQEPRA